MEKEIKLLCYWCGEEMGTIKNLDSTLFPESEYVADYTPCEICQTKWKAGDAVAIEVLLKTEELLIPPLITQEDNKFYPTGRYELVSKDWVRQNIDVTLVENILKNKTFYAGPEEFNNFFNPVVSKEDKRDI